MKLLAHVFLTVTGHAHGQLRTASAGPLKRGMKTKHTKYFIQQPPGRRPRRLRRPSAFQV
jgi:hypothetical protein